MNRTDTSVLTSWFLLSLGCRGAGAAAAAATAPAPATLAGPAGLSPSLAWMLAAMKKDDGLGFPGAVAGCIHTPATRILRPVTRPAAWPAAGPGACSLTRRPLSVLRPRMLRQDGRD